MALVRVRFGCKQEILVNANVAADVLLNHVRNKCAREARELLTKRISVVASELDAYARRKASTEAAGPPRHIAKEEGEGEKQDPQEDNDGKANAEEKDPTDDARESLLSRLEEAIACRREQLENLQAALAQCAALEDENARVELLLDGNPKGLADAGTASALECLGPLTQLELAMYQESPEGETSVPQSLIFDIPNDDTLVRVE
ncbi:Hypothetical Protein FCC1311_070732 [Hondaea fermentalgiana]|uniref:Uncharacterized protein n=1 Tax=Hondaea fermentalgiana TaxID=2315210 RepID=A0A2R5GQE9_9STRA|nr:Hypothetical Protein FCC1311_070732 [Hondaea fermentalgiana]|eukprot:GBG30853.1 Hypothetical Protein FCC1311_070732 [Hondaea fermentalgiana]